VPATAASPCCQASSELAALWKKFVAKEELQRVKEDLITSKLKVDKLETELLHQKTIKSKFSVRSILQRQILPMCGLWLC
jgi:hypothetical protein